MEKSVNLLNFTFRPSIFKNLTDVRVLSSKFDTLIAVDSSKDKFKQINHYKWMAVWTFKLASDDAIQVNWQFYITLNRTILTPDSRDSWDVLIEMCMFFWKAFSLKNLICWDNRTKLRFGGSIMVNPSWLHHGYKYRLTVHFKTPNSQFRPNLKRTGLKPTVHHRKAGSSGSTDPFDLIITHLRWANGIAHGSNCNRSKELQDVQAIASFCLLKKG